MGDVEATQDRSVKMPSEENKLAGSSKLQSKFLRLVTVFIYFGAVSGAAFMLSLYYIFLWNPEPYKGPAKLIQDDFTATFAHPASGSPIYSALVGHFNTGSTGSVGQMIPGRTV